MIAPLLSGEESPNTTFSVLKTDGNW